MAGAWLRRECVRKEARAYAVSPPNTCNHSPLLIPHSVHAPSGRGYLCLVAAVDCCRGTTPSDGERMHVTGLVRAGCWLTTNSPSYLASVLRPPAVVGTYVCLRIFVARK